MPRYKIIVEYDGGPFVGWQRQDSGPSIQAALEDAVFALCGERVMVHGAGRTDAGVHALGQVAHFEIAAEKRLEEVRGALTFHLKPQPIVVVSAEVAPDGFHARFSATHRRYRYRILNRRTPAALERGHVWHVPVPLDTDAMQAAADVLIGKHDFNSFRSINCQAKSSIKTLDALAVSRCRRGDRDRRRRALVPAQPGAHPGRHPAAGRPRPVAQGRCRGGARRQGPHAGRADRAAARPLPDGGALRRQAREADAEEAVDDE